MLIRQPGTSYPLPNLFVGHNANGQNAHSTCTGSFNSYLSAIAIPIAFQALDKVFLRQEICIGNRLVEYCRCRCQGIDLWVSAQEAAAGPKFSLGAALSELQATTEAAEIPLPRFFRDLRKQVRHSC